MFQFSCRFVCNRRSVHTMKTSTHLSRCYWVRKTNLRASEQSVKFHVSRGDPSIISFVDYSQGSASVRLKCYKKRHAQQLTEAHSMHALFSVCSLRDDNVITSKPTWKQIYKLYSRVFWIFLSNIIKIDTYNFELYRFKVGSFCETVYNLQKVVQQRIM